MDFTMSKGFRFFIVIALLQFSVSAKVSDYLKWDKIEKFLADQIAKLEVSFNLDLVDLDLGDHVNVSSRYDFEMEPSFIPGQYLRVDKWTLQAKVRTGDIFDELNPVHLSLSRGSNLYFLRNFSSQKKAAQALPYTLKNFPTNSLDVQTKLKVGDYLSFPADMTISVSTKGTFSQGPVRFKGGAELLLNGNFTVSLYRINETHTRVKLIAKTKKSARTSVNVDTHFDSITGVAFLDDKINGLSLLDLYEFYGEKSYGEQYVIDYIFDLSKPEAREAFDRVIKPSYRFSAGDLSGKHRGIQYFEDKLVSDFAMAEKLHHAKTGAVERVFKGFNRYDFHKRGMSFRLLVSSFARGKAEYDNRITVEDRGGNSYEFYFPNRVSYYKENLRLGPLNYHDSFERSYHGLVPLGSNFKNIKYSDVGMSFWREDKILTRNEWKKIKQNIYDTIPYSLLENVDFSAIDKQKRRMFSKIKLQVLFKENAFESLKNIEFDEVKEKLSQIVTDRKIFRLSGWGKFTAKIYRFFRDNLGMAKPSINSFAKKMHQLLTDPKLSAKERVEKLIDMPDKLMFRLYGIKLLTSLLPQEQWEELVYFDLEVLGFESETIKYTLGEIKHSEVYNQILLINKELFDPSQDLRIIVNK